MRCLLDTHTLLWWFFDDPKLSILARETISAPDNDIFVSAASAWEIATKYRIGKLPEAGDITQQLSAYIRRARFTELSISVEHALLAGNLPGPHRDPFDRMLMSQATILSIPLITTDPVFRDYGVQVIW
ncbi:type II toxin-antitoxin system VapC family toxin [Candidatus Entotheonella palauensis]|uniref:Twitching motility protein PilT n=1 Tax=Candidatus Entotheonella gemina TaxID=1429439 RepID=W4MA70_9BACT|nr:type II toxin-antitoxin system VapC family toxin [Candidatus Entotheonella palauensis]ETX06532.1 MAG: twitching motility protein PilT [Candidatus Entotheonella gemina]